MGLGDWLEGVDQGIDNAIGKVIPAYGKWAKDTKPNQTPVLGSMADDASGVLTLADHATKQAERIPLAGDALKFTLDIANRSWDTLLTTAQAADASDVDNRFFFGSDPGTFFNKATWAKAWDSWGTKNHVSAGQLVSNQLQGDPRFHQLDPFDAQDAQAIQRNATNTWYGGLITATTDLAAGFGIPGVSVVGGTLKALRSAKTVNTLADADRMAETEQAAFGAGELGDLKRTRVKGFAQNFVGRAQDPTDQVARLRDMLNKGNARYRGSLDGWVSYLRPMMEDTPDGDVAKLATLLSEVNRVVDTPDLASHLQMNLFLAIQGSSAAKSALVESAPLVAKSLENATIAPRENGLFAALQTAHATEGANFDPGTVIRQFFDTAGDKAEGVALDAAMDRAHEQAKAARELWAETRAAKPTKGFDAEALKRLRAESTQHVRDAVAELRAAKADHRTARGMARGAYRTQQQAHAALRAQLDAQDTSGLDAALGGQLDATQQVGRSEQAMQDQAWTTAEARARAKNYRARKASARDAYGPRAQMSISADTRSQLKADKANLRDAEKGVRDAKRELAAERRSSDFGAEQRAAVQRAEEQLQEANRTLGEYRTRVQAAEEALTSARADRDLFHSTPLVDETARDAWRSDMATATTLRDDANWTKRWYEAEKRHLNRRVKAKRARIREVRPGVNRANDFLNDWYAAADPHAPHIGAARIEQTWLDQVKTHYRDYVGEHYLFRTGDANRNTFLHWEPSAAGTINAIGTNRARGAINVNEVSVGSRELSESLRRSGVFIGDEVRAFSNEFIAAPAAKRHLVVEKVEKLMLERIAHQFRLTPKQVKVYVGESRKAYGHGRAHLAKAVNDQQGAKLVTVQGADGERIKFHGAWLRSHLADTVGFVDPHIARQVLNGYRNDRSGLDRMLSGAAKGGSDVHDKFMQLWKHGVLVRPGLGVRAMLDTGIRATAMLGAATQFVEAVNGTQHLIRNRGGSTLAKIARRDPASVRYLAMGHGPIPVYIGAGKKADMRAYQSKIDMDRMHGVLRKGAVSPSEAFRASSTQYERSLRARRHDWADVQPDDEKWPLAYTEFVKVLGASPTAKHLMSLVDKYGQVPPNFLESFTDEMFKLPGVEHEYRVMVQSEGVDREQFIKKLADQVAMAFPDRDVLHAFLQGKLTGKGGTKLVEDMFPPDQRFITPGPDAELAKEGRKWLDRFYRAVLDQPDLWLARHPVYVTKYRDFVKEEAAAAVRDLPDGEWLDGSVLETIDKRARARAAQTVRRTFYDNTRYTGAHAHLAAISPFFMPWEDAMMSWSRLMYDDPTRIFTVTGLWNAPDNVSSAVPGGLVVDENGEPVSRGQQVDGETYVQLPIPFSGGQKVRWRKQSFNSIVQGNVPWLPGFGPTVQVGTTVMLGSQKIIPHDVALDLIGTDNPIGKTLLKSMYLDGVPPEASAKAVGTSLLPSWARNLFNDTLGYNYGAHVGYAVNQGIIDAQKEGVPFDRDKILANAKKQAGTAAVVRLLSSGLFGMSGSATVDGQFYVDQMHKFNAMEAHPELLRAMGVSSAQEAFSKTFPEAAELDWRMTKNETGINATVNAQKNAVHLKGMIDKNPAYGWFIVGSANVGGEFSRAAYNQQLADKYGVQKLGRNRETSTEQVSDVIIQQGWDQYDKFMSVLDQQLKPYANDPNTPTVRAMMKAKFVQQMAGDNSEWVQAYNQQNHKRDAFLAIADKIADTKRVRDRPDMVTYRTYREMRQAVLDHYGLRSFSGTSANSMAARAATYTLGQQLAGQNLGFRQAWDRILAAEVEPEQTDTTDLGVSELGTGTEG